MQQHRISCGSRPPRFPGAGLTVAVIIALSRLSATAIGAPFKGPVTVPPLAAEFQVDHADPERSVPSVAMRNAKPLEFGYFIQDLATLADGAAREGDHAAAVRYYRAFTKAVPDSGVGFAKLCQELETTQRLEEAIAACRAVLGLSGVTLNDYVRFVHLVLQKKSALSDQEREDITAITRHLRDNPASRLTASHLDCELGVRLEDISLLKACTAELESAAPRDPKTITFAWALAVREGDQARARDLISRAKVFGVKADGIARMERATAARTPAWRRLIDWKFALVVAMLAAAVAALRLRGQRLTSTRRSA